MATPPLEEMSTHLRDDGMTTVPLDTKMTVMTRLGTEIETETVKNDIVTLKNLPTIEVPIVTAVATTPHPVAENIAQAEEIMDHLIENIVLLVEVTEMITHLRGIERLVMIAGEVDLGGLMDREVEVMEGVIGNEVLLLNDLVELLQI
jgi:hypothetical protein